MTSQLNVDKITGVTTSGSISVTGEGNSTTTNLQQGLAKCWTRTSGDGTSLLDSLNCSSIDDRATGQVDVNFTNSMASVNFYISLTIQQESGGLNLILSSTNATTTAQFAHGTTNTSVSYQDHAMGSSVHGDLA
tara:strand:+ start:22871 stop:23272 length:402 start_codon:yes stop_codon:yes gene_type:complete